MFSPNILLMFLIVEMYFLTSELDELLLLWKLVERELSSASEKYPYLFTFFHLETPNLCLRPDAK